MATHSSILAWRIPWSEEPGRLQTTGSQRDGHNCSLPTVWASLIAQLVKNLPTMQEIPVQFLGLKILWRRDRLPTRVFLGFPCGAAGKESTCNSGDQGLIPGLGRYPGEGKGYPLQYSGLENSMDCVDHGVTKSQTRLSSFHFDFFFPPICTCLLEKP